ncbi:peroxin 13 [Umbelopsis sp. PMI_123]|nr:peroxin 13 [Umbelopsis sp. PMI_123]
MPSPPKPWESANASGNAGPAASAITSPSTAVGVSSLSSDFNSSPEVPSRPQSLAANRLAGNGNSTSTYGGYGTSTGFGSSYSSPYNRMGSYGSYGSSYGSGYGSYGGMSSYSPYNRFGSYGSYGGMGSYGSGYGSYGGYSPYNRMGYNGMPGGPDEFSLTQRMETGTRATFEVIESIVGAFGGFAQMLESTFMATHSSFMAMVGVAEQFGNLRTYLGQVLSIFALIRWAKSIFYKITGRQPPANPKDLNANDFQRFQEASPQKLSRKPFFIFLFAVVGLPYLMHKLIKHITERQQQQQMFLPDGTPMQQPINGMNMQQQEQVDPQNLEFARASYDFAAESPMELTLKKGDIIAILSKVDPATGVQSQWWRGRLRNGTMGLFPANYVEIIQKGSPNNNNNINQTPTTPKPELDSTMNKIPETTPNSTASPVST